MKLGIGKYRRVSILVVLCFISCIMIYLAIACLTRRASIYTISEWQEFENDQIIELLQKEDAARFLDGIDLQEIRMSQSILGNGHIRKYINDVNQMSFSLKDIKIANRLQSRPGCNEFVSDESIIAMRATLGYHLLKVSASIDGGRTQEAENSFLNLLRVEDSMSKICDRDFILYHYAVNLNDVLAIVRHIAENDSVLSGKVRGSPEWQSLVSRNFNDGYSRYFTARLYCLKNTMMRGEGGIDLDESLLDSTINSFYRNPVDGIAYLNDQDILALQDSDNKYIRGVGNESWEFVKMFIKVQLADELLRLSSSGGVIDKSSKSASKLTFGYDYSSVSGKLRIPGIYCYAVGTYYEKFHKTLKVDNKLLKVSI